MWMQDATADCGCKIQYRIVNNACCGLCADDFEATDINIVLACDSHGYFDTYVAE